MKRSIGTLFLLFLIPIQVCMAIAGTIPMQLTQTFVSETPRGWTFFTIADQSFLAIADFMDQKTQNKLINSPIYRWDGQQFKPFQSIPTVGIRRWQEMKIDGHDYLLAVNFQNNDANVVNQYHVDSIVYSWDGKQFAKYQTIPTVTMKNSLFYSIGKEQYLLLINKGTEEEEAKTVATPSMVYRWDGKQFVYHQTLDNNYGSNQALFMEIAGQSYVLMANSHQKSLVYQYNPGDKKLEPIQSLSTQDARGFIQFDIKNQKYVAVANAGGNSMIYKWTSNQLQEFQSIKAQAARHWTYLNYKGDDYLLLATFAHTTNTKESFPVEIYRFNKNSFEKVEELPEKGVGYIVALTISNQAYLLFGAILGPSKLLKILN